MDCMPTRVNSRTASGVAGVAKYFKLAHSMRVNGTTTRSMARALKVKLLKSSTNGKSSTTKGKKLFKSESYKTYRKETYAKIPLKILSSKQNSTF